MFGKKSKKKARPFDTSTKDGCHQMLVLLEKRRMMTGGNGFRTQSTKAGPARQITVTDKMLFRAMGSKALPSAIPGRRYDDSPRPTHRGRYKAPTMKRAERIKFFKDKFAANPRYPSGDRRLREQS